MKPGSTIVLATVLALSTGCSAGVVVADGTPDDLAELVEVTMETVEEALPAQAHCLSGLTVSHARELEDRAEYRVEARTVVLRVPATAPHLEFSLAHEVAHHLELTCDGHEDLRPSFLVGQGHADDHPWFEGDSWETTPSEQFATAVATLVTGQPDPLRNIRVTDEAMAAVERWAGEGASLPTDGPA